MKFFLLLLIIRLITPIAAVIGGNPTESYAQRSGVVLINVGYETAPYYCSGSIISTRHVITVAYCCANATRPTVTAGEVETYSPSADDYFVDKMFFDGSAPASALRYRICVMKLARDIKYTHKTTPFSVIEYPHATKPTGSNAKFLFLGFGQTDYSLDQSVPAFQMSSAELTHLPYAACVDYQYPGIANLYKTGLICAGYEHSETPKRLTNVDSGGPLLRKFNHEVYGIASSFGVPPGASPNTDKSYPSMAIMFTRDIIKQIEVYKRK